jgi:hypothetical protein
MEQYDNALALAGRVWATHSAWRKQSSYKTEGRGGQLSAKVEKISLSVCCLHGLVLPGGQNSKIGQH